LQVTSTASCPAGTTRTGGGAELGGNAVDLVVTILASAPQGTSDWRVTAFNQFGGNAPAYTVTAYALCVG